MYELALELRENTGIPRFQEPVTIALPLLHHSPDEGFVLRNAQGIPVACQVARLGSPPLGGPQWITLTFLADSHPHKRTQYTFNLGASSGSNINAPILRVRSADDVVHVDTGSVSFRLKVSPTALLSQATNATGDFLEESEVRLAFRSARGRVGYATVDQLVLEEAGPVRARVALRGRLKRSGLMFSGRICLFAGTGLVRFEITVENPSRARHRGGYWDLGDPASVLLQDLCLEIAASLGTERRILWNERPTGPIRETDGERLEIFQDSSGGENWRSRNHVNRNGEIPVRFRGYRVHAADEISSGQRADPVVALQSADRSIACAIAEFWEQFPTALEVDGQRLFARILPRQFGDLHEIQAGEHNTRVIWLQFGHTPGTGSLPLTWIHDPLTLTWNPAWYAESSAVPFLPTLERQPHATCKDMLEQALAGEFSFFAKREVIDEYGWRNFGDTWADHESAYYKGPTPIISHYNNQYDLLHGLLVQYLVSGDKRWWSLADPLARHIMDIDIYHTVRDKSAYNGGLFWHTAHYHDAGLCSHRTHSATMHGKDVHAPGGGPANEHNYTSGLLLFFYLTGDPRAREAVIGLADWVVVMDSGEDHLLGLVSPVPTGLASSTTEISYHGPGRGAGNSINVLLDAWMLTGDQRYIAKCEELIRRTIHPRDDIEERQLLDAEMRWSYTVYLQVLLRFLELTRKLENPPPNWEYVRNSVLHYARWMAEYERPYLERSEELEYPTETWAAQELRKGNVLLGAARLTEGAEAALFRERGTGILDNAWDSLSSFDTRYFTRPLALVLQQGYLETYLRALGGSSVSLPVPCETMTTENMPVEFVPQKEVVKSGLRSPLQLAQMSLRALRPKAWRNIILRSWPAERLRHFLYTAASR